MLFALATAAAGGSDDACSHNTLVLPTAAQFSSSRASSNPVRAGTTIALEPAIAAAAQQTTNALPKLIRPHIIMALFDDAGANDIGSFSGGIHTPRMPFLDELMAAGIKLKQYYVQPICSPTRSALMTGRYPIRTGGQHGVAMAYDPTWIPADEVLLPQRLASVGYRCVGAGKWHLGHGAFKYSPAGRGFVEFFGPYNAAADHWEHMDWLGGGPHRGEQRRSQHVGKDNNGVGAMTLFPRPPVVSVDHKHDRWSHDGSTFLHEHVTTDNMTHSTDAFTREAVRMVWEHEAERPLFLFLPFTAPHWPTQFWQRHADLNAHIPGKKRQEFAGMLTHLDESIQDIVEVFKRKGMWANTLLIVYGDNGGDVTTGASNYPYRGTKATVWEGGTRVGALMHSPNPALIPESRRGTSSHTLMHVTDWLPTLCSLAGCSDVEVPGKPLDGVNVWDALVAGEHDPVNGPRTEMLYALDNVIPGDSSAAALKRIVGLVPNMFWNITALRVGDWKLIEGYPGRGDWYGEDPSLAWPVDYIFGPDVTDYGAISRSIGGEVGDGGQFELSRKEIGVEQIKRRWLFNLATDPTEHHDLQHLHPDKVQHLLARMAQLRREQVPPLQDGNMNYFRGNSNNDNKKKGGNKQQRSSPPKAYSTISPGAYLATSAASDKSVRVVDLHSFDDFPEQAKLLIDGEPATLLGGPQGTRTKSRL